MTVYRIESSSKLRRRNPKSGVKVSDFGDTDPATYAGGGPGAKARTARHRHEPNRAQGQHRKMSPSSVRFDPADRGVPDCFDHRAVNAEVEILTRLSSRHVKYWNGIVIEADAE